MKEINFKPGDFPDPWIRNSIVRLIQSFTVSAAPKGGVPEPPCPKLLPLSPEPIIQLPSTLHSACLLPCFKSFLEPSLPLHSPPTELMIPHPSATRTTQGRKKISRLRLINLTPWLRSTVRSSYRVHAIRASINPVLLPSYRIPPVWTNGGERSHWRSSSHLGWMLSWWNVRSTYLRIS